MYKLIILILIVQVISRCQCARSTDLVNQLQVKLAKKGLEQVTSSLVQTLKDDSNPDQLYIVGILLDALDEISKNAENIDQAQLTRAIANLEKAKQMIKKILTKSNGPDEMKVKGYLTRIRYQLMMLKDRM